MEDEDKLRPAKETFVGESICLWSSWPFEPERGQVAYTVAQKSR
jgi:hypothetical protein